MQHHIPFFATTAWAEHDHFFCRNPHSCAYGHGNLPRPRPDSKMIGIRHEDRRTHAWLVGKTGMGKSTLLQNLAVWDLRYSHGLAVIDPNGDLVESLLDFVPRTRSGDVVYFDPSDLDWPIGLNILTSVDRDARHLVADQVISVFKHFWGDSWGPRLENILRYSLMALLEVEGSTLLGLHRLLTDSAYRAWVVEQVRDPQVTRFWTYEFASEHAKLQQESIAPVLNKVGAFLASPLMRNILGQSHAKIDMGFMMDHGRIFLANLSKGKIGEQNSALLGTLLITKFYLAAMGRASLPQAQRRDFFLTIDEAHNVATTVFGPMLSEARKYRLNLTIANQYVEQLSPEIRSALLGNVGTLIAFRLGSTDAYHLAREFEPTISAQDLEALGRHEMALKLAINGLSSDPFRATAMLPFTPAATEDNRANILKSSRKKYGVRREIVEDRIARWLASSKPIRHEKHTASAKPQARSSSWWK